MEKQLRSGQTLLFANEETMDSAELSFGDSLGGGKHFKIWLNGKFIHMSKGFASLERKFKELTEKYSLKQIEDATA